MHEFLHKSWIPPLSLSPTLSLSLSLLLVGCGLGVLTRCSQPDELFVDEVQFLLTAPQTVAVVVDTEV